MKQRNCRTNDLTIDIDLLINNNIDNINNTSINYDTTEIIYSAPTNEDTSDASKLQQSSEDIKYNQLINMKQNNWANISLLNMNYPNENLIAYLKSFNINKAYILDNNVYQDILDNTYYQQYTERIKKIYNSIETHSYIDHRETVPDSCWVKKTSPSINCPSV